MELITTVSVPQMAVRELFATAYDLSIEVQRSYRELRDLYKFYLPRAAGLWIYSVAIVGLGITWIAYEAYQSGRIFRSQAEAAKQFLQQQWEALTHIAHFAIAWIASWANKLQVAMVAIPIVKQIAAVRFCPFNSAKISKGWKILLNRISQQTCFEAPLQLLLLWFRLQRLTLLIQKVFLRVKMP